MQLKINKYNDTIFEWIPYSELIDIKEMGDNCLTTAIWKDGPLRYNAIKKKLLRTSHEKVVLRSLSLYDIKNITDDFTNKVLIFSMN
jgi:hypothetical protein